VHGTSVDGSFFAATRTSNIQPTICLIRQLMDEVDFKFDHGTELRMRRRKSEERQRHGATAMYCRAGAGENSWTFGAEVSASAQTSAQRSRITRMRPRTY
jgi:hypothetical protein